MSTEFYVVWSEEQGAWWARGEGYTHSLEEAGRFTQQQALKIVEDGNRYIHGDTGIKGDRTFNEVLLPDPLAQEQPKGLRDAIEILKQISKRQDARILGLERRLDQLERK